MNQFRSKSFIKIKHAISSCIMPTQLEPCKQMIENATPILSEDEITILKEYYETAKNLIYPVYAAEWDDLLTMYHRNNCGFNK